MKYFFMSLLIFSIAFLNAFSSQEDSAKKTLEFATFLLNENYTPRNLENVSEPLKFKYTYLTKDYFLYSEKSKSNEEFTIKTNFFVGWDYLLIGAGDSDLKDIDIYVYDSHRTLAAIDRNSSGISIPMVRSNYMDIYSQVNNDISIEGKRISIKPLKSGEFTIKIKTRGESNNEGFWSLIILTRQSM